MDREHEPVMLVEVLEILAIHPGETVVDGTLGLAGHSLAMIACQEGKGIFVGTDWDKKMLQIAEQRIAGVKDKDVFLFNEDYRAIPDCLEEVRTMLGVDVSPDKILLDLGLNLNQILDPTRGISFREDGPLDMRMNQDEGEPASSWLNRATPAEIEKVIRENSDEKWAKRIAQVIVDRRKENPLHTTSQLVNCIEAAVPPKMRDKRLHVAQRTFQAIRIFVNKELAGLKDAILAIAKTLSPGGRMVVLSYHSGEDRQVKNAFRELEEEGLVDVLTKKPMVPTEHEIDRNPASRSGKLRAIRMKK